MDKANELINFYAQFLPEDYFDDEEDGDNEYDEEEED